MNRKPTQTYCTNWIKSLNRGLDKAQATKMLSYGLNFAGPPGITAPTHVHVLLERRRESAESPLEPKTEYLEVTFSLNDARQLVDCFKDALARQPKVKA